MDQVVWLRENDFIPVAEEIDKTAKLLNLDHAERLRAFQKITKRFKPNRGPEYWKLLRVLWASTNEISRDAKWWARILQKFPEDRAHFMHPAEIDLLRRLPNIVKVHRGGSVLRDGFSWSLNKTVALAFPQVSPEFMRRREAVVITGTVQKSDIIAFFDGRREREIITLPGKVKIEKVEPRQRATKTRRRIFTKRIYLN
jgi:hypothetical protein